MTHDVHCWVNGKEVLKLALGGIDPKRAVAVALEVLEWQFQCHMAWVGEEVAEGVIRIDALPLVEEA